MKSHVRPNVVYFGRIQHEAFQQWAKDECVYGSIDPRVDRAEIQGCQVIVVDAPDYLQFGRIPKEDLERLDR